MEIQVRKKIEQIRLPQKVEINIHYLFTVFKKLRLSYTLKGTFSLLSILRNTISKRPIYLFYFNQANEDISPPDIESRMKSFSNGLIE